MNRSVLRAALLADGRSDRALWPILAWVLNQQAPEVELAEPEFRARDTSKSIADEIRTTLALYRPDLLFVHRDAESTPADQRRSEIPTVFNPTVKIVPVRMTEAWLLVDERAIRSAADRPAGVEPLGLPRLSQIESLADPKVSLHTALLTAADLSGRREKRFRQELSERVYRVADLMDDFARLRSLPAFARLEADIRAALVELGRID